ncbi:hypothetical protein RJT34_06108 [Clitoria ternatea]|uniref:Dirigent protein n=1 Tax=Clitoria ternatea TaxID=43366 RepID=A0AAN9K1W0_CLITE
MAFSFHNYALAIFLLLMIIPLEATCVRRRHRRHHHKKHHHPHPPLPIPIPPQNSLHFTLFQHETINKTGYIISSGVEGEAGITETTTPFGTLFVFQDPLIAKVNGSSKIVGIAEGTSITSSFDGLNSISVAKLTLRLKDLKGTVSIVGGTNNMKPSDHPIVGGTQDFLFVQGYVTSSPVNLKGPTVVYKLQFHLYWPPYPPRAP